MTTKVPHSVALANQLSILTGRGFKFETLYDVGANVGNWALAAQACVPDAKIEMFEPLAGRLDDLDSRAKHDQVVHGTLHDIALSDETGTTEIKILDGVGVGSSILVQPSDHQKDFEIIDCPVWRLDDYIAEKNLAQPDFIKIDSQAAELKIVQGAENALKDCQFLW